MDLTSAVVIATYNGEKYILEQIESIINQTRKPDYIVISDDNSKDRTIEICKKSLSTCGIPYNIVSNMGNKGVANNFFNGLSFCKQDIIFFSDQDDIWLNKKIENTMDIFEKYSKCIMVIHNAFIWKKEKKDCETLFEKYELNILFDSTGKFNKELYWNRLIQKNFAVGMCMAINKRIAHIQYKDLNIYHDVWFNVLCAALGDIYCLKEPIAFYRLHKDNVQGIAKSLTLNSVKECVGRNWNSLIKEEEKLSFIKQLQENMSFLTHNNVTLLKVKYDFLKKRKKYIKEHKVWELIKDVCMRDGSVDYTSYYFFVRDIISCLFYREKL